MSLLSNIFQFLARAYSFLIFNLQLFILHRAKYDTAVVRLKGKVVDAAIPKVWPFTRVTGGIQFTDITSLLKQLAIDKKIKRVIFKIGPMRMGWAQAQEIAEYIKNLSDTNKETVAYFQRGGNLQYYLASCCEKIIAPPSVHINLIGLMLETTHFKNSLGKLDIQAQMYAKGKYKSAAEMFTRDEPSPAAKEVANELIEGIYTHLVDQIATGRNVTTNKVEKWIDQGPYTAQEAKKLGLINDIFYYDDFLASLKKNKTKPVIIKANRYFRAWNNVDYHRARFENRGTLALVYANGPILDSGTERRATNVTTDKLCKDIRKIAKDKSIKAVVMRVDSPGGAVLASDLIYHSITRLKKKKPVIVSMGNVAGSGGYYIAMAADQIFAQPATITGSIGVIIGKFNLKGLYQKVGMNKHQFKRGENAAIYSDFGPLSNSEQDRIKSLLNLEYKKFVKKTADSRGMTVKQVEKLAQGRVYLGQEAIKIGLVDNMGGLTHAVKTAKEKMGIPDEIPVQVAVYPRPKAPWKELLSSGITGQANLPKPLSELMTEFQELASVSDDPQYRMPFRIKIL